jgi:hypothetical protein
VTSGVSTSSNTMTIAKNTLVASDDYYVVCKAYNTKWTGNITKYYTTRALLTLSLDFSISPSSGTA